MSYDVVLDFSRLHPIHIYKAARFLHKQSVERVECIDTDSVLFCGGLMWILLLNISVARFK